MGHEFNAMILRKVDNRRNFIAQLKANSKPWPNIHIKHGNDFEIFLSTLVRIEREGQWYLIHCVESAIIKGSNAEKLYEQLIHHVHLIQNFYWISLGEIDKRDLDQRSEQERLRTCGEYPQLKNLKS